MIRGQPLPTDGTENLKIDWSESDLALLIEEWDSLCHPYYRGLLSAGEEGSKFVYDPQIASYFDRRRNRDLSHKQLVEALDYYLQKDLGL